MRLPDCQTHMLPLVSVVDMVWCTWQGYKVSLDGAQRTILVQLIKSCCTIAFVRDYRDLAKFNIRCSRLLMISR